MSDDDDEAIIAHGGADVTGTHLLATVCAVDDEIYDVLPGEPIGFTDAQLEAIFIAAAALPLPERGAFLVRIAGYLLDRQPSDQAVRSAIVAAVS
jgi:hypothetical protein